MLRPRPGLVFRLFLRASRVQGKRATLTIAAIAWGSLSLILLLSFGEGMRVSLYRATQGMGTDLAILWPGETGRAWEGLPPGRPIRPRIEDIELLRQRIDGLQEVCGEIHAFAVTVEAGENVRTVRVIGASLAYGEMRNQIPQMGGRFLNVRDEGERRRSVFLGDAIAGELFGDADPVGRAILMNRVPYTVVGVMVPKIMMGNYGGMDEDHAIIPITTFKAQFGRERLYTLVVRPDRPEGMASVLRQLHEVLGAKYKFDPEDDRVFGIWDHVEDTQITVRMLLGIQLFLGIIGALTLIIGGVGVANIMYAVVKERTREIGVKMALGARPGWITGPIVLEGVLYTTFGGIAGLLMAMLVIVVLEQIPTEGNLALTMIGKPTLSFPIGIGSAVILGVIGMLAGYFPARRAAAVDPAETLRYE